MDDSNDSKNEITESQTVKQSIIGMRDKQRRMLIMLAALTPSFMMGTYIFGADVPLMVGVCAASALFFEWAYAKVLRKPDTTGSYSSLVTGMIVALSLPAGFPLWMAVAGSFIAIVVFKKELSRNGKNICNPAAAAIACMHIMFRTEMNTFPLNDFVQTTEEEGEATGLTPLQMLQEGTDLPGLARLFMGFISGPCGWISVAAVLIGGLFLIWKRVISPVIPAAVIASVFVFALIHYAAVQQNPDWFYLSVFHLFAGGTMFGAFFMATDPITSPSKPKACVIYGAGIGVILMLIRIWSPLYDGVPFAVLIMNAAAPILDRAVIRKKKESVPAEAAVNDQIDIKKK